MPPRRNQRTPTPQTDEGYVTAFERAHPHIQNMLFSACRVSTPLLFATTLFAAGVMKRPLWERDFMWRAALASFLSRWVLVSCAITWMLNGWGPVAAPRRGRGRGRGGRDVEVEDEVVMEEPGRDDERDERGGRDALERELGLGPEQELGEG